MPVGQSVSGHSSIQVSQSIGSLVRSFSSFVRSYVCLYVRSFVCMFVCLYVCLYVCMFVCMYVCLIVCMFVCLYVCMFVCLYVCMSVCLYVCMLVCLYVCMFVCLYVCLFVRSLDCSSALPSYLSSHSSLSALSSLSLHWFVCSRFAVLADTDAWVAATSCLSRNPCKPRSQKQ